MKKLNKAIRKNITFDIINEFEKVTFYPFDEIVLDVEHGLSDKEIAEKANIPERVMTKLYKKYLKGKVFIGYRKRLRSRQERVHRYSENAIEALKSETIEGFKDIFAEKEFVISPYQVDDDRFRMDALLINGIPCKLVYDPPFTQVKGYKYARCKIDDWEFRAFKYVLICILLKDMVRYYVVPVKDLRDYKSENFKRVFTIPHSYRTTKKTKSKLNFMHYEDRWDFLS